MFDPAITMITAVSRNGTIGRNGRMPWHLPQDLRYFRARTLGCPVVMGRRTFEGLGKPLAGRHNIVLSREKLPVPGNCTVVHSPDAAVHEIICRTETQGWVIGGGEVYAAMLPMVGHIYMTIVEAEIEGDVRFPELDDREWMVVSETHRSADAVNIYATTRRLYGKRVQYAGLA